MREIKFRAWDGEEIHELGSLSDVAASGNWRWIDKFTVMQYTGLKDKNGMEIYDRDLLRIEMPGREGEEPTWTGDDVGYRTAELVPPAEVIAEVRIGTKRTRALVRKVVSGKFVHVGSYLNISNKDEVIGNIYENPELLSSPCEDHKVS